MQYITFKPSVVAYGYFIAFSKNAFAYICLYTKLVSFNKKLQYWNRTQWHHLGIAHVHRVNFQVDESISQWYRFVMFLYVCCCAYCSHQHRKKLRIVIVGIALTDLLKRVWSNLKSLVFRSIPTNLRIQHSRIPGVAIHLVSSSQMIYYILVDLSSTHNNRHSCTTLHIICWLYVNSLSPSPRSIWWAYS